MANELTDKELEHSKNLVERAMKRAPFTSKIDLADASGLRYERVKLLFERYPELEVMRKKGLKKVGKKAVGNLIRILNDETHKDNFSATKHVLTKYKTELDEVLESQGDTTFKVEEGKGRIQITFGKRDEEDAES